MEQRIPPVKEIKARIRAKHAPVRGARPDSGFKLHVPSDEAIQRMISLVVETIIARFKNLEAMPFELFDDAGGHNESNLFSSMGDVAADLPEIAGAVGSILDTEYPWNQIREDPFTYECVAVGFQIGFFAGVYQATHSADALRELGKKFFRAIKAQPRFAIARERAAKKG